MTPTGSIRADSAESKAQHTAGLVHLIEAALRKHKADEGGRESSARTLLSAAIALYAESAPLGDVSLAASETIAVLAPRHRRRGRCG